MPRRPRLGILGGSFNPIHHGHLIVATRVAEALDLERVLLIPAAVAPLKDPGALAPARDRWEMLRRAIRGNPLFEACDLELRRGGLSYTVDTLRELHRRRPADYRLILGADAARLLPRWKEAAEVVRLARPAVAARPGHGTVPGLPKKDIVEVPLLEISGTEIRDRVRRGLSIRYLVPDAVERYIRRRGLYRR
ncbi:MAG TPA: nicotinate-nucleotide adenylyltransferase [Planctomycetota bacterium]|nr:nicotinate-nucleotide adenylyltransferase [Planctomycetota bacterium]